MFSLIQQVSQLARLDEETLQAVAGEVRALDKRLADVYAEQAGRWQAFTLLDRTNAPGGDALDGDDLFENSPLAGMPRTRAALGELGLGYVMVRLAKLEANELVLQPHDHLKLSRGGRFRLHLPVVTNAATGIVIERLKIYLAPGHVWKLNPVFRFAASNLGTDAHLHLILDCRIDERLAGLLKDETLDEGTVECLPAPTRAELNQAVIAAAQLARRGDFKMAEHSLLKLAHLYYFKEGLAQELVARMYESLGDDESAGRWMNHATNFSGAAASAAPTTETWRAGGASSLVLLKKPNQ